MAAHIILSMDGSMKAQCAGAEYLCHGILVPSGISHAVDTQGGNTCQLLQHFHGTLGGVHGIQYQRL